MVAGNFVFADPADGQVNLLGQILSAIQSQEPVCPAENVQHWTAVVFIPQEILNHPTFGQLFTQSSEYQFLTNPTAEAKDIREAIADALNADGWNLAGFNPIEKTDIDRIIFMNSYSICAEN